MKSMKPQMGVQLPLTMEAVVEAFKALADLQARFGGEWTNFQIGKFVIENGKFILKLDDIFIINPEPPQIPDYLVGKNIMVKANTHLNVEFSGQGLVELAERLAK